MRSTWFSIFNSTNSDRQIVDTFAEYFTAPTRTGRWLTKYGKYSPCLTVPTQAYRWQHMGNNWNIFKHWVLLKKRGITWKQRYQNRPRAGKIEDGRTSKVPAGTAQPGTSRGQEIDVFNWTLSYLLLQDVPVAGGLRVRAFGKRSSSGWRGDKQWQTCFLAAVGYFLPY